MKTSRFAAAGVYEKSGSSAKKRKQSENNIVSTALNNFQQPELPKHLPWLADLQKSMGPSARGGVAGTNDLAD